MRHPLLLVLIVLWFVGTFGVLQADENASATTTTNKPDNRPDKVERDWGVGYFRLNGYHDFVEPRISFIKRKPHYSEVIEYSWRPMEVVDMPKHERIDRIRCLINRYYFTGRERRFFYGAGLGGNIVLFNDDLKDWAKSRGLSLEDGVHGAGRVFVGYKIREVRFMKKLYPVVARIDAHISPDYKFGGILGRAGDRLELSEIKFGLNFSIE
ncbi:MAG TPA: hypothetical protein PKO06_03665 [Candidatus Ozemobacteraceae bacterium]|nr:hypothetical protein [Candidatus Ozemobacteraceae bacterium]